MVVVHPTVPSAIQCRGTITIVDATKIGVADHAECGSQVDKSVIVRFLWSNFVRMVFFGPAMDMICQSNVGLPEEQKIRVNERQRDTDLHDTKSLFGHLLVRIERYAKHTIVVLFALYATINLEDGEEKKGNDDDFVYPLPVPMDKCGF